MPDFIKLTFAFDDEGGYEKGIIRKGDELLLPLDTISCILQLHAEDGDCSVVCTKVGPFYVQQTANEIYRSLKYEKV